MRDFIFWCVVAVVLTGSASYVLRAAEPCRAPIVDEVELAPVAVLVPFASAPTLEPVDDSRAWCEPVDPPPCLTNADCSPRADGAPRRCVPERWVEHSTERVCVATAPSTKVQRWRAARLRVLVDAICSRRDGCDPEALHDYLSALVSRESSWRPYATHRLVGDREANHRAWLRNAHRYVDSPAHDEPWRWQGYGYFGQNAAYLLAEWDATAVPEVLCGEVEATLVHLRTARRRWHVLRGGVDCDDEVSLHHGTTDDGSASWYDISLANSGSNACPGVDGHRLRLRRHFERSARSRGLNPYGKVTLSMLGRDVLRDEQVVFAKRIRAEMDRQYPNP